jgi:hypothetical protein
MEGNAVAPPSRKAATPVSGISPTEYLTQRIWGPAQFPLRLHEIMPVLPVSSATIEYTQETSFVPSAAVVPETNGEARDEDRLPGSHGEVRDHREHRQMQ